MTTLPLKLNLEGRVKNMRLKKSDGLMAVFEAVVNSIHSTEGKGDAEVRVEIIREGTLDNKNDGPVCGFKITDNGHGFTAEHFEHFQESDTTAKARRGGRGVGRFTWLRVFDQVVVSSTYLASDGQAWKRVFKFSIQGIDEVSHSVADSDRVETEIELRRPRDHYLASLQDRADALCDALVRHILIYLLDDTSPRISVIDIGFGDTVMASEVMAEIGRDSVQKASFLVDGRTFQITHLFTPGTRLNSAHYMNFCAQSRVVKHENMKKHIPNLVGAVAVPGRAGTFVYSAYITGETLDACADDNRRGFDFDNESIFESGPHTSLDWDRLVEEAVSAAREMLEPVLRPLQDEKVRRYEHYIESETPHYRNLLKHHRAEIERLPPNLSDNELDTELYKIEQYHDRQVRAKITSVVDRIVADAETETKVDDLQNELTDLLAEYSDSGESKLARHVQYRHAIIALLERAMGIGEDGKFVKEDLVHEIFCPMHSSSEDVPPDRLNLWLLDDKLFYHTFLASDMKMSQYKDEFSRESPDRPDIAIFKRPMAFSSNHEGKIQSVVIVEFKRPGRTSYDSGESKNPIEQVLNYCQTIRNGEGHDRYGHPVRIGAEVPFYAYIVADITETLEKQALNFGFRLMPDGEGYFMFNPNFNCYAQLMGFRSVIRDARRRHRVFFEKLGLPPAAR